MVASDMAAEALLEQKKAGLKLIAELTLEATLSAEEKLSKPAKAKVSQ